jgi:uncharacterized membrane protein YdfJ with MMPL/SSD domain
MNTLPNSTTELKALIADLNTRRRDLTAAIEAGSERRRGPALAAAMGDAAAAETLRQIADEEKTAQSSIATIDIALAETNSHLATVCAAERAVKDEADAEVLSASIDILLEVDDELDTVLDRARELFAQRREFLRDPILRRARTKSAGALVIREREMASALLAYFDTELHHLRGSESYASITRVADFDAKHFGKQSPAQIERGPRPLTAFERSLQASVARTSWATGMGGFGHDSEIEHQKFRSKQAKDAASRDARR